ncbi:MAG: M56 family metallopeptidase, partial [Roseimicrobium sp.]
MSALSSLNVALHALLLSALGWGLVKWGVRDARHRAWAALVAACLTLGAPLLMEMPRDLEQRATVSPLLAPNPSWKPDWKVSAATVTPQPLPARPSVAAVAVASWSLKDVAGWAALVWLVGSLLLCLRHFGRCFAARRWRRSLREMTAEERGGMGDDVSRARLRVFDGEGCPCVTGLLAPVVVVPAAVFSEWTPQQWRWLLRHEGEHLRGHDTRIAWCLGWAEA